MHLRRNPCYFCKCGYCPHHITPSEKRSHDFAQESGAQTGHMNEGSLRERGERDQDVSGLDTT